MPTDCDLSNSTLQIISGLHFSSYRVLNQIYLILGLSGNVILLISFYKQSKTEKAYGYQIILCISKILETVSFSIFLTTLKCFSGAENEEADWFVSNYPIMWSTARLGPVAHMVFIVTSLLLTLAMTVDRLFALTKPFVYKNINRIWHQILASLICLVIGVSISVSDAWRYDVHVDTDHYKLVVNENYVQSNTAIIGAHLRTLVRLIGVIGLIILNTLIAVIFRRRSRKIGRMSRNDEKEKARRQADKNLLILNISVSILMTVNQTPHMGYHILAYTIPSFTSCYGIAYSPIADAMIMLTDSVDLFILMAINKKIRRMVLRAMLCTKGCTDKEARSAVANAGLAAATLSQWKRSSMPTVN